MPTLSSKLCTKPAITQSNDVLSRKNRLTYVALSQHPHLTKQKVLK